MRNGEERFIANCSIGCWGCICGNCNTCTWCGKHADKCSVCLEEYAEWLADTMAGWEEESKAIAP